MLNLVWPCRIHLDMINRFKLKIINFGEYLPLFVYKMQIKQAKACFSNWNSKPDVYRSEWRESKN